MHPGSVASSSAQLQRYPLGRKIHYGHVLAAALELTRLPGPLDGVLSRV